jgi:hypothetical protein
MVVKKSHKITLATFAFVLLAGAIFYASRSREPVYAGRTLRSWLNEFGNGYESIDTNAVAAIQAIGTNGLPVLLAELEHEEPSWRKSLRELTDELPTDRLRLEPPWNRNLEAAYAFHVLGAAGKPAIPELAGSLSKSRSAIPAAIALAGIGQDALPQLANALNNTNARIRMAAAHGLGGWRGDARKVVPLLVKALRDEKEFVRWDAAGALSQLRQEPEVTVPALIRTLDDRVPSVRTSAALALWMFGKDAEAALPALRRLQEDADAGVRQIAESAIEEIQKDVKEK